MRALTWLQRFGHFTIMYKSIDFELYCLSQIARFFSGKAPRFGGNEGL